MITSLIMAVAMTAEPADSLATQAFQMIGRHNIAMVSTVASGKVAKPYGSIMAIDLVLRTDSEEHAGAPYVFISDLARHTEYIEQNPNVSIMVFEPDDQGNVFNGARVTFDGAFFKVEDEVLIDKLKKSYVARHADAEEFIDFGDFNFYILKPEKIFYIGGFGEISYVDLKDYQEAAR